MLGMKLGGCRYSLFVTPTHQTSPLKSLFETTMKHVIISCFLKPLGKCHSWRMILGPTQLLAKKTHSQMQSTSDSIMHEKMGQMIANALIQSDMTAQLECNTCQIYLSNFVTIASEAQRMYLHGRLWKTCTQKMTFCFYSFSLYS